MSVCWLHGSSWFFFLIWIRLCNRVKRFESFRFVWCCAASRRHFAAHHLRNAPQSWSFVRKNNSINVILCIFAAEEFIPLNKMNSQSATHWHGDSFDLDLATHEIVIFRTTLFGEYIKAYTPFTIQYNTMWLCTAEHNLCTLTESEIKIQFAYLCKLTLDIVVQIRKVPMQYYHYMTT